MNVEDSPSFPGVPAGKNVSFSGRTFQVLPDFGSGCEVVEWVGDGTNALPTIVGLFPTIPAAIAALRKLSEKETARVVRTS